MLASIPHEGNTRLEYEVSSVGVVVVEVEVEVEVEVVVVVWNSSGMA